MRCACIPGQLEALGDQVDTYYLGPAGGGEHDGPQPNGSESDDEDRIAARNACAQYPLVGGPEPAGHEGAVCVGQPVWQVEQGTCLGQQIVGVAPVALPAVCSPLLGTTPDHEPLHALLAAAATKDVVDNDPVAWPEARDPWPYSLDLS